MYVLLALGSALQAGAGPLSLLRLAGLPSPRRLAGDHASEATDSNRRLERPCSLTLSRNLQMRPSALQAEHSDVPRRCHTLQPLSRGCCWWKGCIRFAVGVTGAECAWACGGSLASTPDKGWLPHPPLAPRPARLPATRRLERGALEEAAGLLWKRS